MTVRAPVYVVRVAPSKPAVVVATPLRLSDARSVIVAADRSQPLSPAVPLIVAVVRGLVASSLNVPVEDTEPLPQASAAVSRHV